jgi:Stage II sporulation protein E (SpoIIE)
MDPVDASAAFMAALDADPSSIPEAISSVAAGFGATQVVIYMVDLSQSVLLPVPGGLADTPDPPDEPVEASVAGRAFTEQQPVVVKRDDGFRIFVPILEGSDRTGVLSFTLAEPDQSRIDAGVQLGRLIGFLIATHTRSTDTFHLYRRRQHMNLAASLQWDQLPPMALRSNRVRVAGALEPAYEVGGDSFDYAVNGSVLDMAVFDAMGHGIGSAVMGVLTMGEYRYERRHGGSLVQIHRGLNSAVLDRYRGEAFSTGQLARLDIRTGELAWTNAGHPLPLLIRDGRVIGELECRPTLPWGLELSGPAERPVTVAAEQLQPGDGVLFHTDGVTEAQGPESNPYGVERLSDLAARLAADRLPPEETVRRLVNSVMVHRSDDLADDATVVLLQWEGPEDPAA